MIMKKIRIFLATKIGRYIGIAILIVLLLVLEWISNRPEPKVTRQIGRSSDDVQALWTRNMYLWDYGSDWENNIIYVVDRTEHLMAIDSLTGSIVWDIPLTEANRHGDFNQFGAHYFFTNNQTLFTVTSTHVNAYRASTGELLWYTKLGGGHVGIYVQEEDDLLRVYYGDKIFEISQASGEIISTQQKDDIVWIQNDIEIHCPLTPSQNGAVKTCWVGLTGIDRTTGTILWKNNKPIFSEYYQEQPVNNVLFVKFPGNRICALNPDIGEYDWCLPEGNLSNITIAEGEKSGYLLRYDFNLVKINLLTGDILTETQFLPMILPEGMQRDNYGYRVAVTKDAVIVSFGDSDQTFGLKFNP